MLSSMAIGFSTGVFSSFLAFAVPALFERSDQTEVMQSFQLNVGCFSLIICGTVSLLASGFTSLILSRL
jgi:hypothetical protein